VTHHLVGQVRSTVGVVVPITSTFRFWHIEIQHQPGVWTWDRSVLARC
jgi:hypothetical protein